jgi:hypothetical protein
MPTPTKFSPTVLHDFDRLTRFFDGKEALEKMERNEPESSIEPPLEWDNTLMPIYSIFAKTLSAAFYSVSLRDLSQKWLLRSHWAAVQPDSYFKKIYGERFLVRSVNLPPIEQEGECCNTAVKISSLRDPRVKKLFRSKAEWLSFDAMEGGCLGSSEWMLSLYFRTAHSFSSAREHLIALAKLFQKGLPLEAQVLQSFKDLDDSPLLGLKKEAYLQIANRGSLKEKIKKAACTMYVAPPGAYAIDLPGHRITWFKIDKTTTFFHDENVGLVEMRTIKDYLQESNLLLSTFNGSVLDKNSMTIRSVTSLPDTEDS